MEIYFDRRTVSLLRYIKRHPKATLEKLTEKYDETAKSMLLINLCTAGYLVCTRSDGTHTTFSKRDEWHTSGNETFWITSKGRKLLEDRFDRIWQWTIPTAISLLALVISILSAAFPGIIRVCVVG